MSSNENLETLERWTGARSKTCAGDHPEMRIALAIEHLAQAVSRIVDIIKEEDLVRLEEFLDQYKRWREETEDEEAQYDLRFGPRSRHRR
jgi:hypothetical protein